MLYLYALAGELGGVEDLTGVQGEALVLIPVENAMAVAGEMAARPTLDAETLKAQDRLVRALHDRAASLLPMRFGVTASDEADVVRAVGAREGVFQRLAAVRGCEQMIVRVLGERTEKKGPGLVSAETPGRRYLQSRAAARQSSPELAAIAGAAAALQRDVRVEPAQQAGLHGSVYHLIERGRADQYRAAVERAAAALAGVRVVVSGPSPPYAFA